MVLNSPSSMHSNNHPWGVSDETDDAEVQGIFHHANDPPYEEALSHFEELLSNSFIDYKQPYTTDAYVPTEPWRSQARHLTPGPIDSHQGTPPPNPFRFGLSPGLDRAAQERSTYDFSSQWYENLPQPSASPPIIADALRINTTPPIEHEQRLAMELGLHLGLDEQTDIGSYDLQPFRNDRLAPHYQPLPVYYGNQVYQSTVPPNFQLQFSKSHQYDTVVQSDIPLESHRSFKKPGGRDRGEIEERKDMDTATAHRKRQELEESPHTRTVFKDFYKIFRAKEKFSVEDAESYAESCLRNPEIPSKIHWKIYLELADLSKRENHFAKARIFYEKVNELQPFAHQGWLEYSKMEEECGRLHQCRLVLHEGLRYCAVAEQLLTKAIKHEERMNNLPGARALLARLRTQSVDKAWRTILEGALLEARAGNTVVSRRVFKYLMQNVPWYGPIYFEATRFEEKNEEFQKAITIVEKGLKEIPRYGPLWFNAFRLHETIEFEIALQNLDSRSTPYLSLFKAGAELNLEHIFGVSGNEFQNLPVVCPLTKTKGSLQRAMNCISKELVWKVHFEAALVAERGGGPTALENVRNAYVQSVLRCPTNLCWKVWLAGARAELTSGNVVQARKLLDRAACDVPVKSKAMVLLEFARLEEYMGNTSEARKILQNSRLEAKHEWKVFLESVMLEFRNGRREDAVRAAEDALAVHSGTGRLWAILVQLKHIHGPDAQRLVFREALKQVPKSGEVWCEGARIHMHPLSPNWNLGTAERYLEFAIQFTPQYGDSFIEALRWQLLFCAFGDGRALEILKSPIDDETFQRALMQLNTDVLEQRCVNADPNYGALWFYCKRGAFDTARQVLRTAKTVFIKEITKFRDVYIRGIVESTQDERRCTSTPALAESENKWFLSRLGTHEEQFSNFSTGMLCVNWLRENVNRLSDLERNKILFGSDQIVP